MKMRGRHTDRARRRRSRPPTPTTSGWPACWSRPGLVEPYQLDAARAAQSTGTLAEQLIAAGVVRDEALARTLADHYGCPVLDFRDVEPDPDALALLTPEQARTLRALPIALDGDAVDGRRPRPVPSAHRCGDSRRRPPRRPGRRHAPRPRPRPRLGVPRHPRRRQPRPGLRGPRPAAAGGRPAGCCRRQRGRPGRPGRPDGHHPGPAGPRLRHPHRAVRRPDPGALPDRRRADRRARPPGLHRPGDREPGQDPRRHEHRRAAPAAGRPDQHGRRGPGGRHPGRDHRGRRRREGRHATARQEPAALQAGAARHGPRTSPSATARSSARPTAW